MKFRISNEEFFFCSKHNFLRSSVKPNRRSDRIRFVARLRMLIRCRCSENKQQQDPEKPKGGLPCPEKLTGTAKHPQERGWDYQRGLFNLLLGKGARKCAIWRDGSRRGGVPNDPVRHYLKITPALGEVQGKILSRRSQFLHFCETQAEVAKRTFWNSTEALSFLAREKWSRNQKFTVLLERGPFEIPAFNNPILLRGVRFDNEELSLPVVLVMATYRG